MKVNVEWNILTKYIESFRFGMAWSWINDDRIFFFELTFPVSISQYGEKKQKQGHNCVLILSVQIYKTYVQFHEKCKPSQTYHLFISRRTL